MKMRLKEAALAMPAESLLAALQGERDPEVLEALGAALATKASNAENPGLIQPLLARATGDSDPALRAAAVRGLRGVPSVEFMEKNGGVVTYEQLVRDASPRCARRWRTTSSPRARTSTAAMTAGCPKRRCRWRRRRRTLRWRRSCCARSPWRPWATRRWSR
ncbi:hypothetical protein QEG98_36240 [Myxococcus sp. MxC21-1]|uniref:hypothetical protein n=1 Tax=Myxococcus sp. MxC21-1 TaxID=3041439 RepID=UPI00292E8C38|nr:hypothetical protein [Myxococcus sp. MxC21-1]WNZ61288.1 hypothetical protein QEG98_36240 [Myxococcus sp. MxC21-1]